MKITTIETTIENDRNKSYNFNEICSYVIKHEREKKR